MARKIAYGLLVTFALMGVFLWVRLRDPVGAVLTLIVLALFITLVVAFLGYIVSNAPHWLRWIRGISWPEHVARLESSGKAVREFYESNRAITVDDYRTGCIAYLVDVGDAGLLCLYGQDYFEFSPIDDDPDFNQPRRFPTSDFSLSRHKRTGDVLQLFPGDVIFEPIQCPPITDAAGLRRLGIELEDGRLFGELDFDHARAVLQV